MEPKVLELAQSLKSSGYKCYPLFDDTVPAHIRSVDVRGLITAASSSAYEVVPKSVIGYLQKYSLCPSIPEPTKLVIEEPKQVPNNQETLVQPAREEQGSQQPSFIAPSK